MFGSCQCPAYMLRVTKQYVVKFAATVLPWPPSPVRSCNLLLGCSIVRRVLLKVAFLFPPCVGSYHHCQPQSSSTWQAFIFWDAVKQTEVDPYFSSVFLIIRTARAPPSSLPYHLLSSSCSSLIIELAPAVCWNNGWSGSGTLRRSRSQHRKPPFLLLGVLPFKACLFQFSMSFFCISNCSSSSLLGTFRTFSSLFPQAIYTIISGCNPVRLQHASQLFISERWEVSELCQCYLITFAVFHTIENKLVTLCIFVAFAVSLSDRDFYY